MLRLRYRQPDIHVLTRSSELCGVKRRSIVVEEAAAKFDARD